LHPFQVVCYYATPTLLVDRSDKSRRACERDRTADLILTKNVLYLLSYAGPLKVGRTGFEPV
jgi:hypothetical protein